MLVGFFNHYETGCGSSVFIKTAKTELEIKSDIDDYFLIGLIVIDLKDMFEAFNSLNDKMLTNDMNSFLTNLDFYCPLAHQNFIKYGVLDINFRYTINLS